MNNLFAILLLASVVCLAIGLIKPTVFSRVIKGGSARKKIGLVFGIATLAFFVLFGVTSGTDTKQESEKVANTGQSAVTKSATSPTASPAPINTATPAPTSTPANTPSPVPTATAKPPTPTPTPKAPTGLSRSDPIPKGASVKAGDGMILTVANVTRGAKAYSMVKDWNMFNDAPATGKEIVLVSVGVQFDGPADKSNKASGIFFRVVGNAGTIYDARWDVLNPEVDQELFGGGKTAGYISFDVPIDEQGLILMYSPTLKGTVYLSLE